MDIQKGSVWICDRICLAQGHKVEIVDVGGYAYQSAVWYKEVSKDNMGYGIGDDVTRMFKDEFLDFYSPYKGEE